MNRARHLAVLLLLSACPPMPTYEGKLCSAEGECPTGLTCFNARCRAEACDPDELGQPCAAGVGACARPGTLACRGGQQVCDGEPATPTAERCNGLDDDCNGAVDDAVLDAGAACTAGLGACASPGAAACSDGGFVCVGVTPAPGAETCNGVDDDCDGFVDDGCLTTAAGIGPPGDRDGPLDEAMFHRPWMLAGDGRGNVFVADSSNNKVKVIQADGGVRTIAGSGACGALDGPGLSASLCQPFGVDLAPNADLWVGDNRNRRVRLVRDPLGAAVVETRLTDAGLNPPGPRGVRALVDGGVLVTDASTHRLYVGTTRGTTTIGSGYGIGEGSYLAVQLESPVDALPLDDGALLISENGASRLRYLPLDGGFSSVFAGAIDGGDARNVDGVGVNARFNGPWQLALDADAGRVLLADTGNNQVRAVPLDPTKRTSAVVRGLSGPVGLAWVGPRELAISEANAHHVRRAALLDDGGATLSGWASGSAGEPFRDGDATTARLQSPDRVTVWPGNGVAWVEPTTVRLLFPDSGHVLTLAKPGDAGLDGPLHLARIGRPIDVKAGPDGGLYVTDFDNALVRVIDHDLNRLGTFAGPGAPVSATFFRPTLLAFSVAPDGEDLLFVTDGTGANAQLRRFGVQSGSAAIIAGLDSGVAFASPTALVAGSGGTVWLVDDDVSVRRFELDGGVSAVYNIGRASNVHGLAIDARGRVVFPRGRRVSRVDPSDAGVELLFDSQLYPDQNIITGFADGPFKVGILWNGTSLALDGERVWVTDQPNNRLRVLQLPH